MIPYIFPLSDIDAPGAFQALHHHPYSVWLDSADQEHPGGGYSFIGCFPAEIIEYKNGITTITNHSEQFTTDDNPFDAVQIRLGHYKPEVTPVSGLPFTGGAMGLFGYDLGRTLETLPDHARQSPTMPDMAIGIYTKILAFDHTTKKSWLIIHADDEAKAEKQKHILLNILSGSCTSQKNSSVSWKNLDYPQVYKDKIKTVIEYIKAGDIFQANLSQRFEAALPDDFCAFSHYMHMRTINPAPYAAYMNLGNIKISSASPEQFLHIKDGLITTRPIKGTRPRVADEALNTLYKNALQNSDKDKAENTMIVDLLRNDLSKVCLPDSVDVPALHTLESFAGVHHLVSTVQGGLTPGYSAMDTMKACFPGGSITGAPKIRAMEIIDELEPKRRGPYCGSMAYIGFDDNMDSNILIRTLVYEGNAVSFNTGGGITADSKPEDEYQETMDKAAKIFESFAPPPQEYKKAS